MDRKRGSDSTCRECESSGDGEREISENPEKLLFHLLSITQPVPSVQLVQERGSCQLYQIPSVVGAGVRRALSRYCNLRGLLSYYTGREYMHTALCKNSL